MRLGSSRKPTTRWSTTGSASATSSEADPRAVARRTIGGHPPALSSPAQSAPGRDWPRSRGSIVATNRQRPAVEPPLTADVHALRARITALEAREAEHERSERVQAALFRI